MLVGPLYQRDNRCTFRVWAPELQQVSLRLVTPRAQDLSLEKDELGYWQTTADGIPPGSRYRYLLEGTTERPDPASQFQPEGVHGPSEVLDHGAFPWTDAGWEGNPLEDMVIYELHVGTFTPAGTFEAIVPRLAELRDLGITTVELMPVAQFPGARNWGYDGAYPYAVQDSYGGPTGLKTLVNAIHHHGLSAVLDVVYNHFGPEGCYVQDFGPYLTGKYRTSWGDALNYDQAYSYGVRSFFLENALFWLREYHFDGLRLDALHGIYDQSAKHFLQELTEHVKQLSHTTGRKCYLIGESDLDDVRLITPIRSGGYGLDAQWCDDFHHSLHALLTGERAGYYEDFGTIEQLAKAFREGFVYSWQYSRHRKRFFGSSSRQRPGRQFVVFSQNHDQVGNRMLGERSSRLTDFESLKLAAGAVLLSPYVPLLFMGQEYAEEAPFLYFVSHTDADLIAAVREGRRNEFKSFRWEEEVPDPEAEETFLESKLRWEDRDAGRHGVMSAFCRRLLELRRGIPHVVERRRMTVECHAKTRLLVWHRRHEWGQTYCLMNFGDETRQRTLPAKPRTWTCILDSSAQQWGGPGATPLETVRGRQRATVAPKSIAVFSAGLLPAVSERAVAEAAATREE